MFPSWWPRRDGQKPAGLLTCGVALTSVCTDVVDHPWSCAELSCHLRRSHLPGTRSRWRWKRLRCLRPSHVVFCTWASTPHSILHNCMVINNNSYYSLQSTKAETANTRCIFNTIKRTDLMSIFISIQCTYLSILQKRQKVLPVPWSRLRAHQRATKQ